MAKLNGRYRRGCNIRNAANWPGFASAMHKGAELVRTCGGNYYSVTCYIPRHPYYGIDTWDGVNSKRTNEDTIHLGPYKPERYENLPRFWIKRSAC